MAVPDDAPRCVFCRQRPVDPVWRPFCSERCRIRDLARWAEGSYAVPGDAVEEPGEAVEEPGEDERGNNT